jgi:hypothetical protein
MEMLLSTNILGFKLLPLMFDEFGRWKSYCSRTLYSSSCGHFLIFDALGVDGNTIVQEHFSLSVATISFKC